MNILLDGILVMMLAVFFVIACILAFVGRLERFVMFLSLSIVIYMFLRREGR